MRILSVDDDVKNLYLIKAMFSTKDDVVISARNGAEALDTLEKASFDLIISDILMPKVDGWQLCYEVKTNESWKHIPFVFYTATYTSKKDEEFAMSLGASRFIFKPLEPGSFISIINNLIEESKNAVSSISKLEFADELRFLKAHNDRLVSKLNQKVGQLESSNEYLQGAIEEKDAEIIRRMHIEESLRKSEDYLHLAAEAAGFGIYSYDFQTGKAYYSPEHLAFYGLPPDATIELDADLTVKALLPEDKAAFIAAQQESSNPEGHNPGIIDIEFRIIRTDGQIRWLRARGRTVFEESDTGLRPVRTSGIVQDITDRKKINETIRANEQKYRELFERMSSGVAVYEAVNNGEDFLIKDFNRAGEKIENVNRKQVIGKLVTEAFPGVEDFGLLGIFRNVWKTGNSEFFPAGVYKDNRIPETWRENWVYSLPSGEIVAVYNDITEKKQAERALLESEERLHHAVSLTNIGIFKHNFITGKHFWSAEMRQIHEYEPDETIDIKEFIDNFHPEDREHIIEAIRRSHDPLGDGIYSMESRFRCRSGKIIHTVRHAKTFFEGEGNSRHPTYTIGAVRDITDSKLAEQALRESKEQYRTLLDVSPVGIMVHVGGKIIFSNPKAAEIFGLGSPDELIGKHVSEIVHPENREKGKERDRRMMAGEKGLYPVEERYIRPDGSEVSLLIMAAPVTYHGEPAAQVVIQDITEQKRSETELRKLGLAMKQSPTSIVITDTNGNIEYVNPKFEQLTGYSMAEVLGKNSRILKSGETSQEEYKKLWETINSGGEWRGEFHNKKKSGELYWEVASISPVFDEKGVILHFLAIKEDITGRKLIEEELNKYHENLENLVKVRTLEIEKAKEEAVMANRAKSIFLSSMSHEIRTPLNAIIGFSQLLLHDEMLSEKNMDYMKTIMKSGEHLLELINNILDLSKIEAGNIPIKKNLFNLREFFTDIETMFRIRTNSKNIELQVQLSPGLSEFAITDEGKLRQILINLVGNAVKFTEKGSISINARSENGVNGKIMLIVEIKDTGAGISTEEISKLFHVFSQTETGAKYGGTGLGLNISMQYAKMLGGEITVKSEPGVGSCFTVTISMEEASGHTSSERPRERKISGIKNSGRNYRILIADDDKNNRKLLREMLNFTGFEIKEAADGFKTIEIYRKWLPQIILMDIRMPVIDGYETIKRIREMDIKKELKIIVITASAFEEERERALDLGADGYLRKPFKEQSLFEYIRKYLNVEFLYEDEKLPGHEDRSLLTTADLADIPDEIIGRMVKSAVNLEYDSLLELNDRVIQQKPETGGKLQILIKAYQYDVLVEILKDRMNRK